jgi:ribosome-associated toxin RatA of RatAB toxin-antitoxin module
MALRAQAERSIPAPAADVYRFIADYERHHPRFVPPKAIHDLEIEEGGVGAGTVFRVTVTAAGGSQIYHMRVDEPEPGRVLTESEIDGSTVTTYAVEPDGERCRVRLVTTWEPRSGISGLVDRLLGPPVATRLYRRVLEGLDRYARGQHQAGGAGTTGTTPESG